MVASDARIAIIGGGLGGLVSAALLDGAGFNVQVYEQAETFSLIGAGIHVTPNVVKILQQIGIGQHLAAGGIRLSAWIHRKWDSGEIVVNYQLGAQAESRYGAPYLMVHRGDFHALLLNNVRQGAISFGKRLVDLDVHNDVRLKFSDGTEVAVDVVIAADGARSRVREILVGEEKPRYTKQVAYRSIFPTSSLSDSKLQDFTRWASEERAFLQYFIRRSRQEIYVVARAPEPEWPYQTSSVPADIESLRAAFAGFHPDVQRILEACTNLTKWAIFEGDPLPIWSRGRIVLLGDACHPMTPNIGQGAAMAIEDAVILARCIEASPTDFGYAFRLYVHNRKGRASRIQEMSHTNSWLTDQRDADWVFGYDAMGVALMPLASGDAANPRRPFHPDRPEL
jgi:6-hydroxynicotinate 3-monooxygenase